MTIVKEPEATTWGIAFQVPDDEAEATVTYLNIREQAGYQLQAVEFHPDDGSDKFELEVYISLDHPDNIYFEPSATIEEIVDTVWLFFELLLYPPLMQIIKSRGQSGTNLEYALRLAEIHRRLAPHVPDPHLFEIENRLLRMCEANRIQDKILIVLGYKLAHVETS